MNNSLVRLLFCLPLICCLVSCGSSYPADNYEAAKQAAQELDWEQTARLLHRHLRDELDETRRWESWKLLAQAQEKLGEREWLVETLEAMRHEYDRQPEKLAWVLQHLGAAYEGVKKWDKASEAWLQLLDEMEVSAGDTARLYRHMGRYYQRLNNFELAEDMFIMGLEHADTPACRADCRYNLAYTAYLADKMDDARLRLNSLLADEDMVALRKLSPAESKDPRLAALLGQTLLLLGDVLDVQEEDAAALELFKEAQLWHPHPAVPRLRAEALNNKKNLSGLIQPK